MPRRKEPQERSPVIKRSVVVHGHKTSISMEDAFWVSFKEIAKKRSQTISALAAVIDQDRAEGANLSSSIRLFILAYYRSQTPQPCVMTAQEQSADVRGNP